MDDIFSSICNSSFRAIVTSKRTDKHKHSKIFFKSLFHYLKLAALSYMLSFSVSNGF